MIKLRKTKLSDRLLKGAPLTIVDIGASGGIDPRWNKFTSELTAVLVEPDSRETPNLDRNSHERQILLTTALADRAEKKPFYLCRKQQVSSLYRPNESLLEKFPEKQRMDVVSEIEIETATLDSQLKLRAIPQVDFIKIDVQGAELAILKGATETLPQVIGLELEVEFVPIYEGQPLFPEVNQFVTEQGFQLYDLRRYYWSRKEASRFNSHTKGQLIFADALYFRTPESLLAESGITGLRVVHAVCTYLAYRYVDIAHVLYTQARERGILKPSEITLTARLLDQYRRRRFIPHFRGRNRMRSYLQRLGDQVAPSVWHFGTDHGVGN